MIVEGIPTEKDAIHDAEKKLMVLVKQIIKK
jgi:hypothetical protein